MGDFSINKGDSCYLTVIKTDEAGTQIDFVEGEKVLLSAKKNLKQEEYDIQSELATLTDGQMIIYLTPADTNITLGDYYYDIQYTDLNDDVYTLSKGKITIDWDVTEHGI
jgi:hypothetical protein